VTGRRWPAGGDQLVALIIDAIFNADLRRPEPELRRERQPKAGGRIGAVVIEEIGCAGVELLEVGALTELLPLIECGRLQPLPEHVVRLQRQRERRLPVAFLVAKGVGDDRDDVWKLGAGIDVGAAGAELLAGILVMKGAGETQAQAGTELQPGRSVEGEAGECGARPAPSLRVSADAIILVGDAGIIIERAELLARNQLKVRL